MYFNFYLDSEKGKQKNQVVNQLQGLATQISEMREGMALMQKLQTAVKHLSIG